MIRTQKLVPQVYYNRSRDFQLLGRIYDIVFNYVKTSTDSLNNFPLTENTDNKFIDLVATTLGFKQMHNYNIKQLKGLCSIFMIAIRNKGSLKAIELVIRMILNSENISENFDTSLVDNELSIYVPHSLTDLTLLYDILSYILPAGISCNIVRQTLVSKVYTESYTTSDAITYVYDKTYKSASITPPYGLVDVNTPSGMNRGINDNMTIMGYEKAIADGKTKES